MAKQLWSNVRIGQAIRWRIYPIHLEAVKRWNSGEPMHFFETLALARREMQNAMREMRDEYEAELERLRQQIQGDK